MKNVRLWGALIVVGLVVVLVLLGQYSDSPT
jgi:hypothetical protein